MGLGAAPAKSFLILETQNYISSDLLEIFRQHLIFNLILLNPPDPP